MPSYLIEPWPAIPKDGMSTGKIPAGVKVTDMDTGRFHCCAIYRSQHQNKEAAIEHLKASDFEGFEDD